VVLTGILSEQAAAVQAAYQPAFDFGSPTRDEEWVLLAGTRR
jgi:ribosomal protein L11 methylase PrmA